MAIKGNLYWEKYWLAIVNLSFWKFYFLCSDTNPMASVLFQSLTWNKCISEVLTSLWLCLLHSCSMSVTHKVLEPKTAKELAFSEGGNQWQLLYISEYIFHLNIAFSDCNSCICISYNYMNVNYFLSYKTFFLLWLEY